MSEHPATLELDAIGVELDSEAGPIRAIESLSLTLRRGQTVALVGESGCGKSMTALALMRLLPDNGRFVQGAIRLEDEDGAVLDLLTLPEHRMRALRGGRIGMIFQEPGTSLNPVLTVGTQLLEAIEAHTLLRGVAARARAIEWLERVGIPEPARRFDDYPFRLSGGQKQRVMIAMMLAAEPDFLIADEPTTALDVTIQRQVLDLLRDLQRERGLGLLLITHDLAVVSGMAHEVALMYAGQIVERAPAAEFFAAPRHPYARLLLQALPDAQQRGRPLAAIAGSVPRLSGRFEACRFAPRCPWAQDACRAAEPELRAEGTRWLRCVRPDGVDSPVTAAAPWVQTTSGALAPQPPLLEVRGLDIAFPIRSGLLQRVRGEHRVVQDLSFAIAPAETLALVGESGCGKTTTGRAIVQLLRGQARIGGQILLQGRDLATLQGADLLDARRQVQIIFQDPFASLNPRQRVGDILQEGLRALRPDLDAAVRQARIHELCDQVGLLADALQRWPHEFSGGQRQRIAIARALSVQPQLLICDEPTSALDVSVQAQILNLLRELQQRTGVAMLFITHNIGVVEYIAHRVAVMQAGRLIEIGAAEQVLNHPREAYTRTLLDAVPRLSPAES
jgi:peptide/nickel transport system ATP-binding protein